MKRKLLFEEIKRIPIVSFLAAKAIFPSRIRGNNFTYCSPFRNESNPSFHVDHKINRWYDFGVGKGGNIIDLYMVMENKVFMEAIKILSEYSGKLIDFSILQPTTNSSLKIIKIKEIEHTALIKYLNDRFIHPKIGKKYLQEVHYLVGKKKYFALGFQNDKGGYELRSKFFKGSSSPKYFSTIKGKSCTDTLNIIEGFFDFLSAVTHARADQLKNDSLILNSLTNMSKAQIIFNKYQRFNLFLDNDAAGEFAVKEFLIKFPESKNLSKEIYPDHKDFNEYLISKIP